MLRGKHGIVCLFLFVFCLFGSITNVFGHEIVKAMLSYDGGLYDYEAEAISIKADGKFIDTETGMMPIILQSRTLVPLRSVFEALGGEVSWNAGDKSATVKRGGDVVIVKINNNVGLKNDEEFEMDVPAKIINESTMIPVRAISECLGFSVDWNNDTRVITINTPEYEEGLKNKKTITMVWDQIGNAAANDTEAKRVPIDGLDVISPTWFYIGDNDGNVVDRASMDYVDWAHSQGYQVWALFSNDFNTERTHIVLGSAEKRQRIINQIVTFAEKYKLDGINIDFESIGKEDGDNYLQFIKEITPILKSKNLVVSVDMYIPTQYTEHYKMAEVGKTVDYVIIMAYDEHWSTCKESGSVASINWVDSAMKNTCSLVENDKLIMGVPFYTRRWAERTVDGKVEVSSVSMTMEEAYNMLVQVGAEIVWNEACGQYYGEFVQDGALKKIWLEDERSIEEKMKVAQKYGVAGIAAWKRGHEKPTVWNVINKYF